MDNYTLDKVLSIPGHSVLAKFDKSYAYGEKEDEFKALCAAAYNVPNLLLGEIPIQEYGDKENEDLRAKYSVDKKDYPVFVLFTEANKDGLRYSGLVTAEDLSTWLRRNQVKMPAIGTIAEMDELVKKFLKEGLGDDHIAEAKKLADGQFRADKKAPIYVKMMEKVKEKGETYIETETNRITKLMEGKLTPDKMAELNEKIKILHVFAKDNL